MTVLEMYNGILDKRASEYRDSANSARLQGDERAHSLFLMQANMLGDMLKQLGRVEYERLRPGLLQAQIDTLEKNAERLKRAGDYDSAEREQIKAHTIRFAQDELRRLEAENG